MILNWTWGRLPATPRARGSFVQLSGLHVRYIEQPGSEPAVLLLHGQPGTAEDWERVAPLLRGRRTVAIDRPGYGFSSGDYVSMARQVRAIDELRAKLALGRPILVGHSYGGTTALSYAEARPQGVAGLVLVDAGAACTHVPFAEQAQARLVQVTELPVIAQIADVTFSQLLRTTAAEMGESKAFSPGGVDQGHRRRLLAINLKHGNLEAYAGEALAANGVIAAVNRSLAAIHVPTVVIQGDGDELVKPRCGRVLASSIPGARLDVLAGSHMQPYTHPAAVAAAVATVAGEAGRGGGAQRAPAPTPTTAR